MSNASSPHQGGPTPSSSTQGNPVRYNPYQKPGSMAMMNGRPAMIANPMCAMASNGQMVMANQVQIGNPAQLQGKNLLSACFMIIHEQRNQRGSVRLTWLWRQMEWWWWQANKRKWEWLPIRRDYKQVKWWWRRQGKSFKEFVIFSEHYRD